jgi:hypothetical protein
MATFDLFIHYCLETFPNQPNNYGWGPGRHFIWTKLGYIEIANTLWGEGVRVSVCGVINKTRIYMAFLADEW